MSKKIQCNNDCTNSLNFLHTNNMIRNLLHLDSHHALHVHVLLAFNFQRINHHNTPFENSCNMNGHSMLHSTSHSSDTHTHPKDA